MPLNFYGSVVEGLKLKVWKFWGIIPTFGETAKPLGKPVAEKKRTPNSFKFLKTTFYTAIQKRIILWYHTKNSHSMVPSKAKYNRMHRKETTYENFDCSLLSSYNASLNFTYKKFFYGNIGLQVKLLICVIFGIGIFPFWYY